MTLFRQIFLICFFISLCFASKADRSAPGASSSGEGILDLRQEKIDGRILLNGKWKFYWRQLISRSDSANKNFKLIDFPFRWDKGEGQNVYPAKGYATYSLTILLPPNHPDLALNIPQVYSAYRLYVNGNEVSKVGNVSEDERNFKPLWLPGIVSVYPESDTLNICLQVANFQHSKGGVSQNIIFGDKATIQASSYRLEAIDWCLAGCLFMGGSFFLGLYLLSGRDKAILSFALYSIVYSYRIVGADSYELHRVVDLPWSTALRLEYITLFLGVGLFCLYTKFLYREDFNKYIYRAIMGTCMAMTLITLGTDPYFFTSLIDAFLIVTLLSLIYLPTVYISAYQNRRTGAVFSLISLAAMLPIFFYELIHYWDSTVQMPLLYLIGYIMFFFMQSLVLSHRFSYVLKLARRQAEQGLEAKSNFLSTMSHEVRTPLNSVVGISHFLLQNSPRQDQREQLETLLFSANNLTSIVNDILDYNKLEAGKIDMESIDMDIVTICQKILRGQKFLADEKSLELRFNYDSAIEKILIKGDPTRFYQVINNITHNAIKFTSEGYVALGIEILERANDRICLKIQIKDTGIGIPDDKLKHIFERFTQADSSISRSYGGTGLGLSICKRILELQNSRLEVFSEPGKGSVFFFVQSFSWKEKPAETISGSGTDNLALNPLAGKSVLLVEDNPMNVLVAKSFLQRWGMTVSIATNGREAIDAMAPDRYDIILMDLHMPVMDGYEAAEKLRLSSYHTPIIALTADIQPETQARVFNIGMNAILSKPFVPDELYEKIMQTLGEAH